MASTDSITNFANLSGIALPPSQYTNVDLLIGSNAPDCFIIHDQRTGKSGEPYAQRYPLGWAIIGPLHCVQSNTQAGAGATASQVNLLKQVSNEELSTQLAQFWRYDFPDSVASNKASLSVDDKIAEKIVSESIKKVEGRYMLRMPFRTKPSTIPNNRTMAETRMKYLHRKLQRDSKLKEGYVKTVQGYISAGYARKVPPDELAQDTAHGVGTYGIMRWLFQKSLVKHALCSIVQLNMLAKALTTICIRGRTSLTHSLVS